LGTAVTVGAGVLVNGAPAAAAPEPSMSPAFSPVFAEDAPDPDIVRDGNTYYAFTTGTGWGNHIGVLKSAHPDRGWRTLNGLPFGNSAFRSPTPNSRPASWQVANTQNAPGVFRYHGQWFMYYNAVRASTGRHCLSVATAPSPDAQWTDRSGSQPLYCSDGIGGVIDASPFIDANGKPWLTWKSNDGGSSLPAALWSAPLAENGLGFVGIPNVLLLQDNAQFPWQTTIENPQMRYRAGTYTLFFSTNKWDSSSYGMTHATCAGPAGPCIQNRHSPWLASYGDVRGPGGGGIFTDATGGTWLAYHAWTGSCTSYSCGGERNLFVTRVAWPGEKINCAAPAHPSGYRMFLRDGTVFTFGNFPFCGSVGGTALAQPIVTGANTPTAAGYWLAARDGGIFSFGDAAFFGSTGGLPLVQPIVGMTPTASGKGYWLVAADGGIFAFGDAKFFGSMGGSRLARPIVGMTVTPSGKGYWLVASDGGMFAFGDAKFFGSMGGSRLAQPIVGMTSTPSGNGYWLVAADGGIFAYGDAKFFGSTGAITLVQPIVGMTSTPSGNGYWFVAADGGVFAYGDAGFFGSIGGTPLQAPVVSLD
jgi:hypothetical protein